MSSVVLTLAAAIGVALGTAGWAIASILLSEERQVTRRLRSMTASERSTAAEADALAAPFPDRVLKTAGAKAGGVVRTLMPATYLDRLAARIRLSGPHRRLSPELFVLMRFALGAVGVIAGFALSGLLQAGGLMPALLPLVVACVGYFGPTVWLTSRTKARQNAIRRALPDMLDMLMVSVEAGLGFDAALMKVVSAAEGPLSQEFSILLQELQAGAPRREAMQHLAARTNVPDLSAFAMAVVQADTFGVSIANTLRQQSKEMRLRRRQNAEERAQAAPAQMTFPLVICILPATLIIIAGPAVIKIGQTFGMLP